MDFEKYVADLDLSPDLSQVFSSSVRNLRLPEFDKNRNVDQQKALVFQSETCKYDVILGADFLTKTGIDVKYSSGTMEWFDSELPLCNSSLLEVKDFQAMAELTEVQQEEDFLAWTGMIQPAMQLRS